MLDHHLCRNWKPQLMLGATALSLMLGSGQSEAACTNPPAIGWPEGNIPAR